MANKFDTNPIVIRVSRKASGKLRIELIGGNGEMIAQGEARTRRDHVKQTADRLAYEIHRGNFRRENWNARTKTFDVVDNGIFEYSSDGTNVFANVNKTKIQLT